jgi:2-keto-3-deoxy-L-rhamnonate aldolase RhmA
MYRTNPLNAKLAGGGCVVGCWSPLASAVAEAVKAAGKLLGSIATAVDDVAVLRGRGYQFIISSSDVLLLRDAACQDAKRAKEP